MRSSPVWVAMLWAGCQAPAPGVQESPLGAISSPQSGQGSERPFAATSGSFTGHSNRYQMTARWQQQGMLIERQNSIHVAALGQSGAPALGRCQSDTPDGAHCGQRLEIEGPGMIEWWENRKDGLAHGFDVHQPSTTGLLRVSLVVSGARVMLAANSRSATFVPPFGHHFRYAELEARDAMGDSLPAWMEPTAEGLALVVDDAAAIYPVVIDPLLTPEPWSMNYLAASVATAGDLNGDGFADIIIGEPTFNTGQGRVVVFYGSASGLRDTGDWEYLSDMIAEGFGTSTAYAGDVNGDGFGDIVVGAPSLNGPTEAKAYLFYGGPNSPQLAHAWSDAPEAGFGISVASAGDVNADGFADVIVGAHLYSDGEDAEGSAWVYLGSTDGLQFPQVWTYQPNEALAGFGFAVASAGDVNADGYSDIVVGAKRGNAHVGRAYLFRGAGDGISADLSQILDLESGAAGSLFGATVSTAGDLNGDGYSDLVVGAAAYAGSAGATVLYFGNATGLGEPIIIQGETGDTLGASVACAGDVNGDGFADVVAGSPSTASSVPHITMIFGASDGFREDTQAATSSGNSEFGTNVAGAGDVNGDGFGDVLVSAPGDKRVYLYMGAASASGTDATSVSGVTNETLGFIVAGAGDINGDGFDDAIVGASGNESAGVDPSAQIFFGLSGSLRHGPNINPGLAGAWTVATAGDTNGDGYSDVLVGVPASDAGQVHIYYGGSNGLADSPLTIDPGVPGFGTAVAGGELTGDGLSDIVVGVPSSDGSTGLARLYLGATLGTGSDLFVPLTAPGAGNLFGISVASVGDLDNDGFGDLVIGDPSNDQNGEDAGAVSIYHGSSEGTDLARTHMITGPSAGIRFGRRVAAAGDVDGDGRADFLVSQGNSAGGVFLVCGSSLDLIGIEPVVTNGSYFGRSLASAGDVNGDGLGDVVIGDLSTSTSGRVALYLGQRGCSLGHLRDIEPIVPDPFFGITLSSGDFNGDGYGDLLIGAPEHPSSLTGGSFFVYWGNDTKNSEAGRPLLAVPSTRQLATPIAPEGITDVSNGFTLLMSGATPFGRSRAVVQAEVKVHGVPFDGKNLLTGRPFAPSTDAVETAIGFLEEKTPYHWRARLLYDPAMGHPQGWSHWVWGGISGRANDVHLRTTTCTISSPDSNDINCNGIDENCDGAFDEGFVGDAVSCGVGACKVTTSLVCNLGRIENPCVPLVPAFEDDTTCDSVDDNCNGVTDENFSESETVCGKGPCAATGVLTCTADGEKVDTCQPAPALAVDDATCDSVDDDCDGFLDEDVNMDSCATGALCEVAVCNPFITPPGCSVSYITGCCTDVSDCPSTTCLSPSCVGNNCMLEARADCCSSESDCNDQNPCTIDSCVAGACQNEAIAHCCVTDADCFDENPCTFDRCNAERRCMYSPTSCGTDGPCGDDSSCWYSGAVVSLGVESPDTAVVKGALPTAVMHIDLTTEAIGGTLDTLRLGLTGTTSLEASLFIDPDGDGIDGDTPLATATVTNAEILFEVGHTLLPATTTTFVVALRRIDAKTGTSAAILLALLFAVVAVAERHRFAVALVCTLMALSLMSACAYTALKLPQIGIITIATDDSVMVTPSHSSLRIAVRGAPIESAPFRVE
ncbi:MAG: hypothetical protein A2289_19860 [Deltaproteobacteria bacterium RIFOXYA12_FULL_58_15]|nr:MAG: hypothetical protein A2289_19860 [Deltaproteobacteria bacterium RIFOXYA12_FULL_58_15]